MSSAVAAVEAETLRAEFEALPVGDADQGERIFTGEGGCSACHSLTPEVRIVGPSLSGIASRAGARRSDYSAEMHLYESILDPDAFVIEGFPGSIMPEGYRRRLSEQQFADLVAFLMTR